MLAGTADGLGYKEIGAGLDISERTVKYHVAKIKEALGLKTRNQLISYYHRRRFREYGGKMGIMLSSLYE
ncbi:MAG TPA: LuxR family transcriptional regulator [Sediminispirochaeta sp.]|nr:LuxR family transcriptional regulator [Sediminispirochaeta sp.]